MIRLLYLSRPRDGVTASDVEDILRTARRRNAELDITGCLAIRSDVFVQVLEGRRKVVTELFLKIAADPRHTDVTLYSVEPMGNAPRLFPDWNMACASLMGQRLSDRLAEIQQVDAPDGDMWLVDPQKLIELLHDLNTEAPRLEDLEDSTSFPAKPAATA